MKTRRRKSGLTLLEVMIASSILAITLSAFLTSFVMAKRSVVLADNRTSAMHHARLVMEELLTHRYSDPELRLGQHDLMPGPVYTVRYWVSQNPTYSLTKDISLSVWWDEPATSIRSRLDLTTSITDALHK